MVRKRKNSDETATTAAPRLTRQRRNLEEEGEAADQDSTVIVKSNKSSSRTTPKTPATGRRNNKKKNLIADEDLAMLKRSRRVKVIKSSSDSDIENKMEDSKHEINRKELLAGESYPTRSRARKDVNVTIQDSLNSGVENEADVTLVEPKRQTKKKRILTEADNTLVENSSPLKNLVKLTRSQAKIGATKTNQIPEPHRSGIEKTGLQNSPTENRRAKNSTLRRVIETPKKVSLRLQANSVIKLASDTITPESSPILVNLTPHRSTKTPKKSPMNIGSPKTHSLSPLRLSKTPRKLTVSVESPATSDKSSVSLTNQSPTEVNSPSENRRDPVVSLTKLKKEISPETNETFEIENSSEIPQSFVCVAKLKLRKSGERPPANSTPSISTKSPKNQTVSSSLTVDEIWAEVSAISPKNKSSSKKLGTLASKIRKSPVKSPASIRKVPSVSNTPTKKTLTRNSQMFTPGKTAKKTPTNVQPSNLANPESPKRPKSMTKKRSPITSSGTPLRPIPKSKENLIETSIVSPCIVAPKKIKLSLEFSNTSPETTPRGRTRRSLHLTPDFTKFSSNSTSSPLEVKTKNNRIASPLGFGDLIRDAKMLNNESLELVDANKFMNASDDLFANSVAHADGTFELSKDSTLTKENQNEGGKASENLDNTDIVNTTYELAEPKTPSLKKQSRKRSLSNVEPDKCTPEAKKRCRVRFVSPAKQKTPISPIGSTRKSLPTINTPAKQRISGRLSRGSGAVDNMRRRSRSLTKINEKTPTTRNAMKRRSISTSDLSNKTPKLNQSIQNSVNRLSRPRQSVNSEAKSEVKLPAAKKAPNFAQIHQKKFAEMESLVDAKKRVAKRHEELNTLPSTRSLQPTSTVVPEPPAALQVSKRPAPAEARNNGPFNRFGFKLRKVEAIKAITKKPAAASRNKNHQENNRAILKGVRTNKRFELQMKLRNMKP